MSEMVARVAMAICKVNHTDPDYPGLGQEVCQQACGYCEARATAAIEAMREPTPEIINALTGSANDSFEDREAAVRWGDAIAAALAERDTVRPSTGKAEPPTPWQGEGES